LFLNR